MCGLKFTKTNKSDNFCKVTIDDKFICNLSVFTEEQSDKIQKLRIEVMNELRKKWMG